MRGSLCIASTLLVALCAISFAATPNSAGADGWSQLPADAMSTISATMGKQIPTYQIEKFPAGFRARNPRQAVTARFTETGVSFDATQGNWSLALIDFGSPAATVPVAKVMPQVSGNRVAYNRGSVTEWYVNGPAGLEQGFTVAQPPAAASATEFVLGMAFSGNLSVSIGPDRTGVTLADRAGVVALRYSGLNTRDAVGRQLPSWLEKDGHTLRIHVAVSNAQYPIVIDPWVQSATLTPSDPKNGAQFGTSIAVSGDTVVVAGADTNAAYVFEKPASGWADMTETARLTSSDNAIAFGRSVAINRDMIVVGAPYATVGANTFQGQVYLFEKPTSGWVSQTETARLISPIDSANASFGTAVAVNANTIVVGSSGTRRVGSFVFVFEKPTNGWVTTYTPTGQLVPGGGVENFGKSLAISGNTIVAGTLRSVLVYVKAPAGWTYNYPTAVLTAQDGLKQEKFVSVGVDGDTVVGGAPYFYPSGGAAYVWVAPSTGWASSLQTARLTAGLDEAPFFGTSVGISGATIVVGASGAGYDHSGAAYVYQRPATGWKTTNHFNAKLLPPVSSQSDTFGVAVSINGPTISVGALDLPSAAGSAYVFDRQAGTAVVH